MKRSFLFRHLMSLWPPFIGAGIRIKKVAPDFSQIIVKMKLRKWNQNYRGVHFGGSIYAMTDPFYMLMVSERLGKNYIVWDKAADIKFKKVGKGTLTAEFNLSKERVDEIKKAADAQYKVEPTFKVRIKDESGDVVAEVDKIIYVRRKDKIPRPKK